MDFAFTEEQDQLRSVVRDWLADTVPFERVVALADGEDGWDPAHWRALAGMGLLDAELGALEHAVLFEETGAALLPAPLFSTLALAVPAVAGDAALRSAVADGERRLTLAWAEDGAPQGVRDVARLRTHVDAFGRLHGRKVLVPDLDAVDSAVVTARNQAGEPALCLLELAAAGDGVRVVPTLDRTRRLGILTLDAVPATVLAERDEAVAALGRVRAHALSAVACEAVGVARRALELATEHARTREQFGRVIGTYQGVSHKVADAYARVELARSLAVWAAWTVAEDPARAGLAADAAAAGAAEAAVEVCETAIQVLGGMGFTWEHPLQRLYKRALWLQAFEGGGAVLRARVADALLV